MTAGRFEHRLFLYDSEDEFLEVVIPFLAGGQAEDEAVVVAVGPILTDLLQRSLMPGSRVLFDQEYSLPIPTIQSRRRLAGELLAAGAGAVRMVGEVPHPGIGEPRWEPWAQYEAVINQVYADLPLTGLCVYDRRTLPEGVLDDVVAVHPLAVGADGLPAPHPSFEAPGHFLRKQGCRSQSVDRLPPVMELAEVGQLRLLRRTLHDRAMEAGVAGPELEDFVLAVSELASDALCKGTRPVTVRSSLAPNRLEASLTHPGPGPDPLDGFLAPDPAGSDYLSLAIARRFARQVDICPGRDIRIRLVAYPHQGPSSRGHNLPAN